LFAAKENEIDAKRMLVRQERSERRNGLEGTNDKARQADLDKKVAKEKKAMEKAQNATLKAQLGFDLAKLDVDHIKWAIRLLEAQK
jgi:hypothetical protein